MLEKPISKAYFPQAKITQKSLVCVYIYIYTCVFFAKESGGVPSVVASL